MNTKITEIIPDNIPQWAKDAMDRGQLFNEMVLRAEAIQQKDEEMAALKARERGLVEAGIHLQKMEAAYRYSHDHFGGDDIRTGRAWDKMRRAGKHMKTALSSNPNAGDGI